MSEKRSRSSTPSSENEKRDGKRADKSDKSDKSDKKDRKSKKDKKDRKDKKDKKDKSSKRSKDEPEPDAKKQKTDHSDSSQTDINSSMAVDTSGPENVTLSDLEDTKYQVTKLQQSLRTILKDSPSQKLFEQILAASSTDDNLRQNLSEPKCRLAVALKDAYVGGKLPVLDDILNCSNVVTKQCHSVKPMDVETPGVAVPSQFKPLVQCSYKGKAWPPALPGIKDPLMLRQVFTHTSYANHQKHLTEMEKRNCAYERLEFLGDSVLNNICTKLVFDCMPQSTEGELTAIRSQIISNAVGARWGAIYGFQRDIRISIHNLGKAEIENLGVQLLDPQTCKDSKFYAARNVWPSEYAPAYEKFLEDNNIKPDLESPMAHSKIVADVFEAYVGAIYLSYPGNQAEHILVELIQELSAPILDSIIERGDSFWLNEVDNTQKEILIDRNAKNRLYIKIGSAEMSPMYNVVAEKEEAKGQTLFTVACVMGTEVIGTGTGRNNVDAGARAAMDALNNKKVVEKFSELRRSRPLQMKK